MDSSLESNTFISPRALEGAANVAQLMRFLAIFADAYDKDKNPDGNVIMAVAENSLMHKEIIAFTNANVRIGGWDLTYGPLNGLGLREVLGKFMTKHFRAKKEVLAEHIALSSGCTAVCEAIAWILGDSADGFLIGCPYYAAFDSDWTARSKITPVGVEFGPIDPFGSDSIDAYERTLKEFEASGEHKIRALVLVNPHNPLGRCYTPETLEIMMKFCQKHKIFLISDELYALSVFPNPSTPGLPTFTSVLSIDATNLIDDALLIVVYGMSKDFGANGLRIGAIIAQHNSRVIDAYYGAAFPSFPSSIAQLVWKGMLEDEKLISKFIDTNSERLGKAFTVATRWLNEHEIPYAPGVNAAFFLWVDLRSYLPKINAEATGWDREMALFESLLEAKVFLAAGKSYHAHEPGWFRIVFSSDEGYVLEGFKRMLSVLKKNEGTRFGLTEKMNASTLSS